MRRGNGLLLTHKGNYRGSQYDPVLANSEHCAVVTLLWKIERLIYDHPHHLQSFLGAYSSGFLFATSTGPGRIIPDSIIYSLGSDKVDRRTEIVFR